MKIEIVGWGKGVAFGSRASDAYLRIYDKRLERPARDADEAVQQVIQEMANYRPSLPVETIRRILLTYAHSDNLMSELHQDVVWAYRRVLRKKRVELY